MSNSDWLFCELFQMFYHYNPGEAVQQDGSVVSPHERQQKALVWFVGTAGRHGHTAEQFTAAVVLAPSIQRQQRHEGRHLEDKVHEHGQSSIQSKGLHRWHGGQGPW